MRIVLVFVTTVVLLGAASVEAGPIVWTLDGIQFDDGGTATGSFVFDADLGLYSDIDIRTTAGAVMAGSHYKVEHPFHFGNNNYFVAVSALPTVFGTMALQLPFVTSPLTNDGGSVTLGGFFNFGEGTCSGEDLLCSNVAATLPFRHLTGGQIIGTALSEPPPSPAPVPEPSSLVLLGTGIAALVAVRRREGACLTASRAGGAAPSAHGAVNS
jgi:hypothetical protein